MEATKCVENCNSNNGPPSSFKKIINTPKALKYISILYFKRCASPYPCVNLMFIIFPPTTF